MTLSFDDLIERAKKPEDFDDPQVTEAIEQLTSDEVRKLLAKDQDFQDNLLEDLRNLRKEMEADLVDRSEAIEIALACFIAHLNMVFLGPPGTAKSLVVRRLSLGLGLRSSSTTIEALRDEMRRLADRAAARTEGGAPTADPREEPAGATRGRRYYEVLLTRYSTSDEILGPPDLPLMLGLSLFYRQSIGLLPEADVAFLDEIWKANSAILNALLSISNERLFYNAGRPVRVPLCMIFGASNEVPREEELWAMYDRFPIRVVCQPVENSAELLRKADTLARGNIFPGGGNGSRKPVLQQATVNHFRLLHRISYVCFDKQADEMGQREHAEYAQAFEAFTKAFCDTFEGLKHEFQISDRSLHGLYRLVLALAMLRGHTIPTPRDLEAFRYCFYDTENAPTLRDVVEQRIQNYGPKF